MSCGLALAIIWLALFAAFYLSCPAYFDITIPGFTCYAGVSEWRWLAARRGICVAREIMQAETVEARRAAQAHEDHVFLTCRGVVNAGAAFASAGGEPLTVCALDQIFTRIGRQAGVERLHPHLLRHTFACMHLLRYRDPFALKSLLGHTTLQMTNHYCEAVRQMEVVRADTTSIVDGIDTKALDVNRRGRLARRSRKKPTSRSQWRGTKRAVSCLARVCHLLCHE